MLPRALRVTLSLAAASAAALGLGACVEVPERDFTLAAGEGGLDTGHGPRADHSVSEPLRDSGPEVGGQDATGRDADLAAPDAVFVPADAAPVSPDASGGGQRLAPQNAFGPGARVTLLEMPRNAGDAAGVGCRIAAQERGSILYGAFNFSGRSLTSYVSPDANGHVEVVELGRILNWPAETPVSDLGEVDLLLLQGRETADPEAYLIETGGNLSRFMSVPIGPDGEFETTPTVASFLLPLLLGGQTAFTLERTTLRGRLTVDGPGFAVRDGLLEGYFTRNGVAEAIRYIDSLCSLPEAPTYCDAFYALVPHGACNAFGDQVLCDDMIDVLASAVGGFDARIEPGPASAASACSGADCNAVGVCLEIELSGTTLAGESL